MEFYLFALRGASSKDDCGVVGNEFILVFFD